MYTLNTHIFTTTGMREVDRFMNTTVMQTVGTYMPKHQFYPCDAEGYTYNTDKFWECYIRQHTISGYHATSSCRMGAKSDPTTVVDPQLR
jgi:choline dehydrogenase-like flavoprotein